MLDEGQSVGRVARELDLTESAFRNWVRQARADRTKGRTGLTGVEREDQPSTLPGLALLMFRISSRISGATPGRPGLRRRLFHAQYRLNPQRCQLTTVPGFTTTRTLSQSVQILRNSTQNSRSTFESRGRFTERRRTASCWRKSDILESQLATSLEGREHELLRAIFVEFVGQLSHIIRTIEYWDIERRRYPAYEHVAVLVCRKHHITLPQRSVFVLWVHSAYLHSVQRIES